MEIKKHFVLVNNVGHIADFESTEIHGQRHRKEPWDCGTTELVYLECKCYSITAEKQDRGLHRIVLAEKVHLIIHLILFHTIQCSDVIMNYIEFPPANQGIQQRYTKMTADSE